MPYPGLLYSYLSVCLRHPTNHNQVQSSSQIHPVLFSAQRMGHFPCNPRPKDSPMPLASKLTHKHPHIHINAGKAITCVSLTLQVFVGCRTIRSCCCYVRSRQSGSVHSAAPAALSYLFKRGRAASAACLCACVCGEKLRDSEVTLLWRTTRRSKTQEESYFVEI